MAKPEQTLSVLEGLARAYPDKRLEPGSLRLYVEHLADVPAGILEQAARRWIDSSQWFPKISELRQLALRIANTSDFRTIPPRPAVPPPSSASRYNEAVAHDLAIRHILLQRAFHDDGRLETTEWNALIAAFDQADCPSQAAEARRRLKSFLSIRK